MVGSDGGAFAYGNVPFNGPYSPLNPLYPVTGTSVASNGAGYLEVGSDGGVFHFPGTLMNSWPSIYMYHNGSAQNWLGGKIVGIAITSDQGGYWIADSNGDVCGFGDASVWDYQTGTYGTNYCWPSVAGVSDVVGIAADPTNGGYWLVGADGGVFDPGLSGENAPFEGSLPGQTPPIVVNNIVGMAPTQSGNGYWLVGSDGGVFAFNASFFGSFGGGSVTDVSGIAGTPDSGGYWLSRSGGAVLSAGDAAFLGSEEFVTLGGPIVGIS
jgi:hypothetical protein